MNDLTDILFIIFGIIAAWCLAIVVLLIIVTTSNNPRKAARVLYYLTLDYFWKKYF